MACRAPPAETLLPQASTTSLAVTTTTTTRLQHYNLATISKRLARCTLLATSASCASSTTVVGKTSTDKHTTISAAVPAVPHETNRQARPPPLGHRGSLRKRALIHCPAMQCHMHSSSIGDRLRPHRHRQRGHSLHRSFSTTIAKVNLELKSLDVC